jgi:hypothetical protein
MANPDDCTSNPRAQMADSQTVLPVPLGDREVGLTARDGEGKNPLWDAQIIDATLPPT